MTATSESRDLRAELIRFHYGDYGDGALAGVARRSLPPALVPAALRNARASSNGWPLVVDLAATGDDFAAPLDERDRATLAASAEVIELDPWAAFHLADRCARRRQKEARTAFAVEARRLGALAGQLLEADRARRPGELLPAERSAPLGSLGDRLFDAARLTEITGRRPTGAPLAAERRRRLEAARELLASFDPLPLDPVWVVADDQRFLPAPATIVRADDPCARAATRFDEAARETALLIGAARTVELEAEGEFDEERHAAALDRLDWRSFSSTELALVAPIFALVDPTDLLARGLASLSRLLLSGRPVAVVVPLDCAPADLDPAAPHFEPAMLGLGHRETYVHQGSIAEPMMLAAGFAHAVAGSRPSLHVIDRPWFEIDGLDLATIARARVAGRAVPLVRYEPETASSWSRRLALDGNPNPTSDWGRLEVQDQSPGSAPIDAPFTFADAALLDPAWRSQFALADGNKGETTADLEPLADWLMLPPERRAQTLPFVVGVSGVTGSEGAEGRRVRLVVTLALARATADRLAFWRSLQELSGVRSEAVERAVSDALSDAARQEAGARAELVRRHAVELDQARAAAAAIAVDRIVATLLTPAAPSQPVVNS